MNFLPYDDLILTLGESADNGFRGYCSGRSAQAIRKRTGRKHPAIPIAERESGCRRQRSGFPDSYRRILPHYGQQSDFPDSYRRATFSTGKTPVFRIPAVGNHQNLRYKTGISCFGRSQILIFAGQYAILLISAAEA